MEFKKIASPCRNYNVLNTCLGVDPITGHEIFIMPSHSDTGGHLIIVDTVTEKVEQYRFEDAGAWAVMQLDDGSIIVGTCHEKGSVQRLDMRSRSWVKPKVVNVEGETYIWDFSKGSDGNIYCADYGTGSLMRYRPDEHKLEIVGKASNNEKLLYVRNIWGQVDGYVYYNAGIEQWSIGRYNIKNDTFKRDIFTGGSICYVCKDYIVANFPDGAMFIEPVTDRVIIRGINMNDLTDEQKAVPEVWAYSIYTQHLAPAVIAKWKPGGEYAGKSHWLANGEIFGFLQRMDTFFRWRPGQKDITIVKNPLDPPATGIHELEIDENGLVWTTTEMGMTMGWYDPKTEEFQNYHLPGGGEVYGMTAHKGRILMTAYAGGDYIEFSKDKPYDISFQTNPRVLYTLGGGSNREKKYIRPHTHNRLDPDGNIWTGVWREYGARGMCLTKWNPDTDQIDVYEDIKPNTTVHSLGVGKNHVWFDTHNHGNGMTWLCDPLFLCATDFDGNLVWEKEFPQGEFLGTIAFAGPRYGVMMTDRRIVVIDDETMELTYLTPSDLGISEENTGRKPMHKTHPLTDQYVALFLKEGIAFFDPAAKKIDRIIPHPKGTSDESGHTGHQIAAQSDKLYLSFLCDLYELDYTGEEKPF